MVETFQKKGSTFFLNVSNNIFDQKSLALLVMVADGEDDTSTTHKRALQLIEWISLVVESVKMQNY